MIAHNPPNLPCKDTQNAPRIYVGIVLAVVFFCVGLSVIGDYGETQDERINIERGEFFLYDWPSQGVEGLRKRFGIRQLNYGPFFGMVTVLSRDYLYKKYGLFSSSIASEHFPVLLVSSLAIFFLYVFVSHVGGYRLAFLSSIFLAITPQFVAHAQNNHKDMPLLSFSILVSYFLFFAISSTRILPSLLAGISLGLAYAIRMQALILLLVAVVWLLYETRMNVRRIAVGVLQLIFISEIALLVLFVVWPYYQIDPFTRFAETIWTFRTHDWNQKVLYLGAHTNAHDLPWHYAVVHVLIQTPLFILIFAWGTIASFVRRAFVYSNLSSFEWYTILWFVLPLLAHATSGAPKYDGIRHMLLVIPPICILAALGVQRAFSYCQQHYPLRIGWLFLIFSVSATVHILAATIRLHPYQVAFYNNIVGGAKGAYGKFDLDYWGVSFKEAAEWLNTHAEKGAVVALPLSCCFKRQLPYNPDKIKVVNSPRDYPDYKIHLMRGITEQYDSTENYLFPRRPACYEVIADDTSLLRIFCYPENKSLREAKASAQPP